MDAAQHRLLDRRLFQKLCLTVPVPLALGVFGGRAGLDAALAQSDDATPDPREEILLPSPSCEDDDDATGEQTEGPYFTPDSPERTSLLESDIPGTPMILAGLVLSTRCEPVPNALVDFWHADGDGVYDNEGYRCRGHQFTDEAGMYYLESVVPGLYPGRTRHFHVKVQAPDQPVLTTQLYFPNEPGNEQDGIFASELLVEPDGEAAEQNPADYAEGTVAFFNFVLDLG